MLLSGIGLNSFSLTMDKYISGQYLSMKMGKILGFSSVLFGFSNFISVCFLPFSVEKNSVIKNEIGSDLKNFLDLDPEVLHCFALTQTVGNISSYVR